MTIKYLYNTRNNTYRDWFDIYWRDMIWDLFHYTFHYIYLRRIFVSGFSFQYTFFSFLSPIKYFYQKEFPLFFGFDVEYRLNTFYIWNKQEKKNDFLINNFTPLFARSSIFHFVVPYEKCVVRLVLNKILCGHSKNWSNCINSSHNELIVQYFFPRLHS